MTAAFDSFSRLNPSQTADRMQGSLHILHSACTGGSKPPTHAVAQLGLGNFQAQGLLAGWDLWALKLQTMQQSLKDVMAHDGTCRTLKSSLLQSLASMRRAAVISAQALQSFFPCRLIEEFPVYLSTRLCFKAIHQVIQYMGARFKN